MYCSAILLEVRNREQVHPSLLDFPSYIAAVEFFFFLPWSGSTLTTESFGHKEIFSVAVK